MDFSISIPYFCFMVSLVLLAFVEFNLKNHNHNTKYVFIFGLILFTLFIGLKGWTGMDVMMYYENYQESPTLGEFFDGHYDQNWFSNFEKGFLTMMMIAKSFGMTYWQFQFTYVFIDAIILYYFFKRETEYHILVLLIYFVWWGWVFHAEQLRNANSVLMFMLSLKYVREKQVFSYIILNILGMTFHTTSLFYIIAYPLLRFTYTKNQLLWIFAVVMTIFIFHIEFINIVLSGLYTYGGQHIASKIQKYYINVVYADSYYDFGMRKIIVCFTYITFFLLDRYSNLTKNIDNVTKNVFIIYFILVFSLCEIKVLQDRASSLFCIGIVLFYVKLYANFQHKLHKQLYCLIVFSLMIIIGLKYFSVDAYRYRTSFTAEIDYQKYDEDLEKRKLKEFLDARKRNKDITKEKNDQLKDFDKLRAKQGIGKVKDQKLHRQDKYIQRKRSSNENEEIDENIDELDILMEEEYLRINNKYKNKRRKNNHFRNKFSNGRESD